MNKAGRCISTGAGQMVAAAAIISAMTGFAGCSEETATGPSHTADTISPSEFLGNLQSNGFPPVDSPWSFRFPADHGPHDQYRTEWWHLAGVLTGEDGSRLGVQLSLARIGLRPGPQRSASRWAATAVYTGRFSLSDPGLEDVRTYQRISRGALGLAGAQVRPLRIWVENWRLEELDDSDPALSLTAQIAAEGLDLRLELHSTKPLVDSNQTSGREAGRSAPFVFYIQPRLNAEGTVNIGSRRLRVSGMVSMEHAWGELPLPGGPVARDRFTLYLDDARELLCIRTHRVDGSGTPATNCLLVGREGGPVSLGSNEIELNPLQYWQSPRSGARYPIRWALRIPGHGVELEISPYSERQTGAGWTHFWAGPVRLRLASDEPAGYGFVQLNGYEEP